jgi:hypothetical protein
MTRLQDLLHSITAVIIRYHDAHALKKLIVEPEAEATLLTKRARELSPNLLRRVDFEDYLKTLIRDCTEGYETRKPLLHYLIHQITFIKAMQERKESFKEEELIQYKQQIAQMLIDFKQLLLTNKSSSYKVSHSKLGNDTVPAITISGVKNDGYFGNKYCFSGDLIRELLERFHFTNETSIDELRSFADDICLEHQNSLLVPELAQAQKKQEELLQSATVKDSALTLQVATLSSEADTLTREAATKKVELEHALATIKTLEQSLREQTGQVKILAEKVDQLTNEAAVAAEKIKTLEEAASIPKPVTTTELGLTMHARHLAMFGLYPSLYALAPKKQSQPKQEAASEDPLSLT